MPSNAVYAAAAAVKRTDKNDDVDVSHVLERWDDIDDRGHPLGPEESDL
jgi:hypothetical protein